MKHFIAAATVAAVAGAAHAGIETQTLPYGFPLSPGNQVLPFNQFDTLGGTRTLTKVELMFTGDVGGQVTAENNSTLDAPGFGVELTGFVTVAFSSLSGAGFLNQIDSQGVLATDNGGVPNGSGPDFHDFGSLSQNYNDMDMTTTGLAAYVGAGTINATVNGSAAFGATGTTDATVNVIGLGASGEVTIKYHWVPGPGAAAMLGVAGLAGLRRRRS